MQQTNVSLTDLGFKFFYDENHKYEVKDGDELDVVPNREINLYFGMRPYQKDDGKWYTKEILPVGSVPYIFFGMYEKTTATDFAFVCGKSSSNTSGLSVSELSLWTDSKSTSFMENLHNNRKEMIDVNNGVYSSVSFAKNDELHMHLEFDSTLMTTRNFDNGNIIASKSSFMQIANDEIHNGTVVSQSKNIRVENIKRSANVSFYIRFKMHAQDDYLIFEHPLFDISFDSSERSFIIDTKLADGTVRNTVSAASIRIGDWESVGLIYSNGELSIVVSGGTKKVIPLSIHSKDSIYKLNMSNIHSITATQRYDSRVEFPMGGVDVNDRINLAGRTPSLNHGLRRHIMSEDFVIGEMDNIFEMIRDRRTNTSVKAVKTSVVYEDDDILSLEKVTFKNGFVTSRYGASCGYFCYGHYARIAQPTSTVTYLKNDRKTTYDFTIGSTSVRQGTGYSGAGYGYAKDLSRDDTNAEQRLMGSIGKSLVFNIKYSSTLEENAQTFPMIWLFPGTQLIVTEIEILPNI